MKRLVAAGELPDAGIADELLKIKPLTKSVLEEAERLEEDIFGVMPRHKITDLLLETAGGLRSGETTAEVGLNLELDA